MDRKEFIKKTALAGSVLGLAHSPSFSGNSKRKLPEVIQSNVDHLIYYYYPRNLSQPDKIMNIIKNNISIF